MTWPTNPPPQRENFSKSQTSAGFIEFAACAIPSIQVLMIGRTAFSISADCLIKPWSLQPRRSSMSCNCCNRPRKHSKCYIPRQSHTQMPWSWHQLVLWRQTFSSWYKECHDLLIRFFFCFFFLHVRSSAKNVCRTTFLNICAPARASHLKDLWHEWIVMFSLCAVGFL